MSRAKLSLELLAQRQQLLVLRRTVQRSQIQDRDRWFWIVVSRIWKDWRQALIFVKPETVIKWHRQGFRRYWCWKSRSREVGRPQLDKEIRRSLVKSSRPQREPSSPSPRSADFTTDISAAPNSEAGH